MKVFEKCIVPYINKIVGNFLDLYQYVYKAKRGVDDAIVHVLNNVCAHLDNPGASIPLQRI